MPVDPAEAERLLDGLGRRSSTASARPSCSSRPTARRRSRGSASSQARKSAAVGKDVDVVRRRGAVAATSPAAFVADEPMQDAGGHLAPVVGGRAHVVDRLDLARAARRPRGRPSRRSGRHPPGTPRCGARGPAWPPRSRAPAARRASVPSVPGCQASAMTTLEMACARRVPTLRKRTWRARPAGSGCAGSARPARAPSAGTPARTRRPARCAPRARCPARARHRRPAGSAACRRRARRWRRCRRSCRGSGSGPRRWSPPPRPGPAGTRRPRASRRISV